tara:strand:+ start:1478 stop:2197 length:720 start_codon:yes stop_codon:yes gene_type:complete
MKNKKIALCISGQARKYDISYKSLYENILKDNQVDIFIHTWKDYDIKSSDFGNGGYQYTMDDSKYDELLKLYNPKSYLLEDPITFEASGFKDPVWRQSLNNSLSMYYSIHKSISLVKDDYDYVIRTRFDLDYNKLPIDYSENEICIPKWYTDHRVQDKGYYDIFAIGSKNNMNIYSQVFSYLISYITLDQNFRNYLQNNYFEDSPLRNEYILKWHLLKNNIKVKELSCKEQKSEVGIIR